MIFEATVTGTCNIPNTSSVVFVQTEVGEFIVKVPWYKLSDKTIKKGTILSVSVNSDADQHAVLV